MFNPIPSSSSFYNSSNNNSVELYVTNLDKMMAPAEMKRLLLDAFQEHVKV